MFTLMSDPFFRIRSAHLTAIVLLVISALFFTQNIIAIILQIIVAIAIFLHHKDDEGIKDKLVYSQKQLKEDTNIFDRNIIVSETNLHGIITYVNSNYIQTSGYSKEELIGSSHSKIKSQNTSKELYSKLWDSLDNNKTFTTVLENKKKDGSPFWVDMNISPIILDGKKVGYKAIMFDITDKVLTQRNLQHTIEENQQELQEQATRFEFAINSSRDGFWDYDLEKKDFYLSSGWKQRLGFKTDEKITYLEYLALVPDDHRFEHHKAMHDLLEAYTDDVKYVHFRIRYPLITKDSEHLIIEDVGDIFFNDEKNPIRITGFHRDITEQERQNKMIETQNRISAMGDMMSNVAHQWRQPIGAINNTLNNIEFDIELDELSKIDADVFLKTSNKIKEYTAYMSNTIDDFRQLTSDDKVKTNFTLNHTIELSYNIVQNEYEKNNIEFSIINSNKDLVNIYGYQRELQQVLINLLNNAKDILIEKDISHPKVEVSITANEKYILTTLQDNGGGIPSNIIEKIFDPYFTTKHEAIGTGIGLYMSKKIITEYFNGSLIVENENDGAKFIISIPKNI